MRKAAVRAMDVTPGVFSYCLEGRRPNKACSVCEDGHRRDNVFHHGVSVLSRLGIENHDWRNAGLAR
jgi:hypothetical protein